MLQKPFGKRFAAQGIQVNQKRPGDPNGCGQKNHAPIDPSQKRPLTRERAQNSKSSGCPHPVSTMRRIMISTAFQIAVAHRWCIPKANAARQSCGDASIN